MTSNLTADRHTLLRLFESKSRYTAETDRREVKVSSNVLDDDSSALYMASSNQSLLSLGVSCRVASSSHEVVSC
jgi:hypothetical protein